MAMVVDETSAITLALAALGVGAASLKLVQNVLSRRNGKPSPVNAGQMSPEWWVREITEIVSKNSNDKILPLLEELKEIQKEQVGIQQKQNEILVELVTVSRIGRTVR